MVAHRLTASGESLGRLLAEEEWELKGEFPPPAPGEECMRRLSGLEDRRAWYSARSLLLVGVPGGVDHFVGDDDKETAAAGPAAAAALEAPEVGPAAATVEKDDDNEEESCRACDADDERDDGRASLLPLNTELRPLSVLQWDSALSWRPCFWGGLRPAALRRIVLTVRPSTVVAPSSSMPVIKGLLLSSIVAAVSCPTVQAGRRLLSTWFDGSIDPRSLDRRIGGAASAIFSPQNKGRRPPPFRPCGCVNGFKGVIGSLVDYI